MHRTIARALGGFVGTVIAVMVGYALLFLCAPSGWLVHPDRQEVATGLKTGNLTANFPATLGPLAGTVRYRANDGPWRPATSRPPRVAPGRIVMELPADQLQPGRNSLRIRVRGPFGLHRDIIQPFVYDPSPAALPVTLDWQVNHPEVQDGQWERIETPSGWRLRPLPGTEGYDRLALVSPPFSGGRGVKVTVTFRAETGEGLPYGFGVIPLWGGHMDDRQGAPRGGWDLAIAWAYSRSDGVGIEVSHHPGHGAPRALARYVPFTPRAGETYHLAAEAWRDPGDGLFRLHLHWRGPDDEAGTRAVTLTDTQGLLTDKPYAVALIAHRAQVEFGAVRLYPLP